ncbi:MAG TPA: MBL fold metallo-hydrolase [Vicinamibacterales bacterium]|nr:MBL fold metallo-hydrolase [Vicinamibacterales bacterium]
MYCFRMGVAAVLFSVWANQTPAPNPTTLPRVTKLADGVFAYEQLDPTKRGVTANNLIVVTSEGVLVADGQGTVENTKRLVSDIANLTQQPIRYVIVGSEHGDHRGGDSAFPPTATFIAHPYSQANLARQANAPDRRENAAPVVVPTETVKDKRVLMMGGREIDILFLGPCHTGGDLEVYLPGERILYMSEVFSNGIFPSMANSYPSNWVAALKAAEQMDVSVYVPAHGLPATPLISANAERTYRMALERVLAEGRRLHDGKVPVDEAADKADFGEFTGWWRKSENAPGAMKRVYMELDGQLTLPK